MAGDTWRSGDFIKELGGKMAKRTSNKALQRRPCHAVFMRTFNAVHGPAERGR